MLNYSFHHQYSHLILTYVMKGVDRVENGEIIVMNPRDQSFSYCLPLLIISFNSGKPVSFGGDPLN